MTFYAYAVYFRVKTALLLTSVIISAFSLKTAYRSRMLITDLFMEKSKLVRIAKILDNPLA